MSNNISSETIANLLKQYDNMFADHHDENKTTYTVKFTPKEYRTCLTVVGWLCGEIARSKAIETYERLNDVRHSLLQSETKDRTDL